MNCACSGCPGEPDASVRASDLPPTAAERPSNLGTISCVGGQLGMGLRAALPGLLLASCLTAEDVHGTRIETQVADQADAGGQAEQFPFTGRAFGIDGQPLRVFRVNGVDVVSRDGRFSVMPECTDGNRIIVLSADGHAPSGAAIDCGDPNRALGDVMLPKGRKLTVNCVDASTRKASQVSRDRHLLARPAERAARTAVFQWAGSFIASTVR